MRHEASAIPESKHPNQRRKRTNQTMTVLKARDDAGLDLELGEYYPAKIIDVVDVTEPRGPEPAVSVVFQILDENGKPAKDENGALMQHSEYVALKVGASSKFQQWWSGLFFGGKGVPKGTDMDPDELLDMPCRVLWDMKKPYKDFPAKAGVIKVAARKARPQEAEESLEEEIEAV
jgi:hypothetical protein